MAPVEAAPGTTSVPGARWRLAYLAALPSSQSATPPCLEQVPLWCLECENDPSLHFAVAPSGEEVIAADFAGFAAAVAAAGFAAGAAAAGAAGAAAGAAAAGAAAAAAGAAASFLTPPW